MTKRVFIIHGWDGHPGEGWFPWLKKELEQKGFTVVVPQMPDADAPKIEKWVPTLAQAVGSADEQTYFIGHSMGCQTIARYLETLSENTRVGGVVFVAGFFKRLTGLGNDPETLEIAESWLAAPIDFQKIKSHLPQGVAIFSDTDPFVPLDNQDDFRDKLGCQIVVEHGKGHFSGPTDKVTQLPSTLEAILKLTR